jgi:hypothetical protein
VGSEQVPCVSSVELQTRPSGQAGPLPRQPSTQTPLSLQIGPTEEPAQSGSVTHSGGRNVVGCEQRVRLAHVEHAVVVHVLFAVALAATIAVGVDG